MPQSSRSKPRNTTKVNQKDTQLRKLQTCSGVDLEVPPIELQQLILDIFADSLVTKSSTQAKGGASLKEQIQTIKSHLFNRDFDSAFADADTDLLRAYALRWSAGRALAYTGVFDTLIRVGYKGSKVAPSHPTTPGRFSANPEVIRNKHILCIGGGAGAEIVALAAAIRWVFGPGDKASCLNLSVTALDKADWQSVIDPLSQGCKSHSIPSRNLNCRVPLPLLEPGNLAVSFQKQDVLALSEEQLSHLISPPAKEVTSLYGPDVESQPPRTVMITLMFTLNELFSTSISKTVTMLLRLTDLVEPGTILLVVDSPGSYSTLSLGSKGARSQGGNSSASSSTVDNEDDKGEKPERKYPMRFLLEHALLTTAAGSWDCIFSQESKWFRRSRTGLVYNVGEGVELEDMRYQVHTYIRTEST